MSDRNAGRQLRLDDALRALPLAAPEVDVWSTLAAELKPQRAARRRWLVPAALAASALALALASVLFALRAPTAPPLATTAPAGASNTTNGANVANASNGTSTQNAAGDEEEFRLATLEARSQDLERWLRETRDAASPLPGPDLAASAEIENLIGLVDVELAASPQQHVLPLWQRRVNLLEDLTALRYSNYRLAETLAAAGNGATPDRIN